MTAPATPPDLDLDALRDGLESAVHDACEAIRTVMRRGSVRVGHKWGEGPVTEADHAADEILHRRLTPLIEGAHWLSEESEQEHAIIPGEPTWVIDPLDGTREFLRGLPEFGVSVGFFANDRLVLGAAGLPAEDEPVIYSGIVTDTRREARVDGVSLSPLYPPGVDEDGEPDPGRIVVSRWDYEHRRLQHRLPFDVYPLGSAVVKLVHAATGEAGVYLSTGPRSVWDAAGGAAVLAGAGGVILQVNGAPLELSPQQERIPPFVAGEPGRTMALLRSLGVEV